MLLTRLLNTALWRNLRARSCPRFRIRISFVKNVNHGIREWMLVRVLAGIPGARVKPFQSGKKHPHGARTLCGKSDQLICAMPAHFTMQVLKKVVAHRLSDTFWRTIPAIVSLPPPIVYLQKRKVGKECHQIGPCCTARQFLKEALVEPG